MTENRASCFIPNVGKYYYRCRKIDRKHETHPRVKTHFQRYRRDFLKLSLITFAKLIRYKIRISKKIRYRLREEKTMKSRMKN